MATNRSGLKGLRSREERAAGAAPVKAAEPVEVDRTSEPSELLVELRARAQELGYNLARESRSRNFRPEPDVSGSVRTTCRLSAGVRRAMEIARLELNVSYTAMIEEGLVMYLDSHGIRV